MQKNGLYIVNRADLGRGVFAGQAWQVGDVIEVCPVITLSEADRVVIDKTSLYNYYFIWGPNEKQAAIALGYGSLYNHSATPNAQFITDLATNSIIIECIKDIAAGEEVLIKYVDDESDIKLWFKER